MLADGDRSTVSWDIDMRRWGRENWGGGGKEKERPDGICLRPWFPSLPIGR